MREPLLTPADAARVLGVTPSTVRLMAKRRVLRVARVTEGGNRLFRRADVEALARKRSIEKEGR
jgi:excisionase family DNA binding protein